MCDPICNPLPQDIAKKTLEQYLSINFSMPSKLNKAAQFCLSHHRHTHLQHTHGSHPSAPVASEFLPYWPQGQPPLHLKHRLNSLIARQFEVSRGMGFQIRKRSRGHVFMRHTGIPATPVLSELSPRAPTSPRDFFGLGPWSKFPTAKEKPMDQIRKSL